MQAMQEFFIAALSGRCQVKGKKHAANTNGGVMYTIAQLKTELTTDPKALGYAANLTSTNDIANASLINSLTSPGAATITLPVLTHDELATLIAPVVMALGGATAALQAKWTPMLNLISGISNFQTTAGNIGLLGALSADFPAQLTAAMITDATSRTGSRAEVLFGAGTVVPWADIYEARIS